MKYTKEERLEIGRQIYDGELSKYEASDKYDISMCTARDYMRLYRDANRLPPRNMQEKRTAKVLPPELLKKLKLMSREEFIDALLIALSRECS